MISEDHEPALLDGPFAFAGAVGAMVGLVKNEESFDRPALSIFGFGAPAAVDVPALGRLWDLSWDSCDGLREA